MEMTQQGFLDILQTNKLLLCVTCKSVLVCCKLSKQPRSRSNHSPEIIRKEFHLDIKCLEFI